MTIKELEIRKDEKHGPKKVRIAKIELVKPATPRKQIGFIGWAKKGKDASCT